MAKGVDTKQYKLLNEDIKENELMPLWYRDLETYPVLVWIFMYYIEKTKAIRLPQRILVPGYAWRNIDTGNIHCEYFSPDGELKKCIYGKYDYPLICVRKF